MKIFFILIGGLLTHLAVANAQAPHPVLYIGDSHTVGKFGDAITANLDMQRADVKRRAVAGATADSWTQQDVCQSSKALQSYCNKGWLTPPGSRSMPGVTPQSNMLQPEYTIIALGTNDATGGCLKPQQTAMAPIKALLSKVRDIRKCIWVGPPEYYKGVGSCSLANFNQYADTLKQTVENSGCKYIDSRMILEAGGRIPSSIQTIGACANPDFKNNRLSLSADKEHGGDGIHFPQSGGYWGKCVSLCVQKIWENPNAPVSCFNNPREALNRGRSDRASPRSLNRAPAIDQPGRPNQDAT